MEVYFLGIVLLTNIYCSYTQNKYNSNNSTETSLNITLRSLSQPPAEKKDNITNHINTTLREITKNITENEDEIKKQVDDTRISVKVKTRKNKTLIFDMETKQYVEVDLADCSHTQTDNISTNIEIESFDNSNSEAQSIARELKTKAGYLLYDSQPKTVPVRKKTEILKISIANNSQILTTNKHNNSRTEKNYKINDTKTFNIKSIPYKNYSSIERNSVKQHGSRGLPCSQIIKKICARIAKLRKVSCSDGTTIPLQHLCTGLSTCPHVSHEKNCKDQAERKLIAASNILLDAEQSNECLPKIVGKNWFGHQLNIWSTFLDAGFQYNNENLQDGMDLISSMFDSFEAHLCKPIEVYDIVMGDLLKIEADFELLINSEDKSRNMNWSAKSCTCNHQFCKWNYCDNRCRRICWQVYVLDHYGCPSVTGGIGIPLAYICDGKIDCLDETDESSCMKESSAYKHKAKIIYDKILKMLSPEVISPKYEQKEIKELTDLVHQLQTLTTKIHYPNLETIKILRNKYFKLLVKIFKTLWLTIKVVKDLNQAHDFLLTLNQNMIKALKSSYTGNKNILFSAGCPCRDGVCVSVICCRKCAKLCLIEPALTKYSCNMNNTFVDIKVICDGNNDCPNGDDENDCKYEVCHARHLDLLRLTLRETGNLLRDIVFDTMLEVWIATTADIIIIPVDKFNRQVLEDKIGQILSVLLEVYFSMIQTGLNNWFHENEFIEVSNIVKQVLKSCGK